MLTKMLKIVILFYFIMFFYYFCYNSAVVRDILWIGSGLKLMTESTSMGDDMRNISSGVIVEVRAIEQ